MKDFGGLRNPMKVVGNDVIASNTFLGTLGAFPNEKKKQKKITTPNNAT